MITSWGLEERLTRFIDFGRPCCGTLRTDPAGQYVHEDATGVMVNTGFSAGWVLDHLRRQSLSGHVWKLDRGDLPYALIDSARQAWRPRQGGWRARKRAVESCCLTLDISLLMFLNYGIYRRSRVEPDLADAAPSPKIIEAPSPKGRAGVSSPTVVHELHSSRSAKEDCKNAAIGKALEIMTEKTKNSREFKNSLFPGS